MIEAGGTFGPDGSYGAALIKTGENLDFISLYVSFTISCVHIKNCIFKNQIITYQSCLFPKQVKRNRNSVKLSATSSPTLEWASSNHCESEFMISIHQCQHFLTHTILTDSSTTKCEQLPKKKEFSRQKD